jgi:hypothetical protein
MRDLVRAAYPVVIRQLTGQGPQEKHTLIDFVHPSRDKTKRDANTLREETR